ncbi:endonuclease VII domain-containing protein [Phytomonospora sp. NPDC050363]|uniref:endonuclease VII domain-containing protein n=1 Tax=Phytomonospora sp. NPDC050363 TaxID=3155642 RepID=UPI0033FC92C0
MNLRSQASYAKRVFESQGRGVRKPEVLPEGRKRCRRCDEVKDHDEFVKATAAVSGLHSYCKPCLNAAAKESRARYHGSMRNYHLKRRYGLTEAQVEEMLAAQFWVCAICKLEHERYHVDHDHVTGKVRGILCFKCNNALGLFEEDYFRMKAAIEYIGEHLSSGEAGHRVPEAHRDPKGTWDRARVDMEAHREHHVRRLHSIFGVPAQREVNEDRRVTGRGSP